MGQAIGQVLSFGVGVALSPVPIIAVVLMLATAKGRVNGLAFLAGWIVGIAVLGTIVLLAASGASASKHGTPASWVSILKIVLGVLLCCSPSGNGAVGRWRRRPGCPMDEDDRHLHPGPVGRDGVALSAINPKNLLLTSARRPRSRKLGRAP